MRAFGQNDIGFCINRKIVQRGHQRPTVHLGLVDLLGAVIQAGSVAQAHSVCSGKQTEIGMRFDDFVLIQQGQLAVCFQNALNDKHHVCTARIIFVEHNGHRVAQGPRQNAFVEFGDLFAILELDGVFADQIDPADVAIKVHTHSGPVQAGGNLFDVG